MRRKSDLILLVLLLSAGVLASAEVQPTEAVAEQQSATAASPPEDPLFPQDISAWTYTPEFAERFKRMKLKEPGPTGAYAANFQVHQIEELDRCVFNVFLDNTLPIDYPEGPVGFLSFTYPMSWAFLKLSPEDQQAVDAAYQAKYREQRAVLTHAAGEEPLTYFQNRANLYRGVAVVTLTFRCDQVATWKNPLRLRLRTTSGTFHEIGLPEHFLGWMHAMLTKWRRPEAKLLEEGLPDRNIWSYTPEFAKRFGLPPVNEPGPTGAQAVAWRVERYHRDDKACFLDVYIDDTVPLTLPESDHGYAGPSQGFGYFLNPRDRADRVDWYSPYSVYGNSELFAIREIPERDQKAFPRKKHLGGNTFRVVVASPYIFEQYRKQALPGLSYLTLSIGCVEPPSRKLGPVGISIIKPDASKHEVIFPVPFTEHQHHMWKELVSIPFRCKYPKLYPRENCAGRVN